MCGIAGEVFRHLPDTERVRQMTTGIRHRGPDDQGIWASDLGECILGHARLAVIDLTAGGHQPMLDYATGNAIVFNGEVYNFQSLREECEVLGDRFRSRSDTEVILALYRRYGPSCVTRLRGMFAIVIWEAKEKRIFMARDRVGKKPLNYALLPDGLAFCSEIDPLSLYPGVDRSIDPEALDLFLQLQYIPAPWTIYRGIRKLPPAHYGLYEHGVLTLHPYWEVDYRPKVKLSEEEALEAFSDKLTEAVSLRMVADVPIGALLSGGVDSSVVVATMASLQSDPVRTFSIGFEEQSVNELPWANQVAEICRTRHLPMTLDSGRVEDFIDIARHYGEPYADASAVPSFAVCKAARAHVTVVMNGDGGDELLGGYPRYWLPPTLITASAASHRWFPAPVIDPAVLLKMPATNAGARVKRLWDRHVAYAEARSITMYSAFWNDEERVALLGMNSGAVPRWRKDWMEASRTHATGSVERMLWIDNRTYLAGDLMVKMDIASMHCGLETRSPFLDHELIEFCAGLEVKHKVKNGVGKYLLKRLAEKTFSKEFVHRPKMGFGIPAAQWLRGPYRTMLESLVRDAKTMAPLDVKVAGDRLDEFLAGNDDETSRIWALLMFALWKRACVERGIV
jgi:asparagine synthase (glutamine-hydrolysing)